MFDSIETSEAIPVEASYSDVEVMAFCLQCEILLVISWSSNSISVDATMVELKI